MKRVINHPILGHIKERKKIKIMVDGKYITAYKGETIAAALIANDYKFFRRTSRYQSPRGFFCGVGQCTDCSMVVNGRPNIRTCVTRVKEGMIIETQYGNGKWQDNENS
jgi:predicted molibdopterin-dependent oxidoreductase YjgC